MKKLILALPFLALPLTAMAQEKTNHFTPELIKATADRFAPAFCSNDPHKITDAIKDCYLKTPQKDQKQLQCFLADEILFFLVISAESQARVLGAESDNPYADIPFSKYDAYRQRQNALKSLPEFDYINHEFYHYDDARIKVTKLINASSYCKKNNQNL